jgi:phosphatidylglycerophosphate synthase
MTSVGQSDPPGVAPRESVGATVRRLAAAQKSSKGAPAYSRFVNRPAGRVLAALAYRAGLTPDTVTVLSACCTLAGIVLVAVAPRSPWAGPAVCAALVLGYALDAADGQLARLRGGGSPAGEWLDHMADAVKVSALHVAVAIWVYRTSGLPVGWALVPLLFTVVSAVHFFGMILTEQLRRQHSSGRAAPRGSSTLRALAALPIDYGVLCFAFALLGLPAVFVGVYTVLFAGTTGYTLLAVARWYREMRTFGTGADT